jgi:hypothetical protein
MDTTESDLVLFNNIKKTFKARQSACKVLQTKDASKETYTIYDAPYFMRKILCKITHNKTNDSFEFVVPDKSTTDDNYIKLNGIPTKSVEAFFYDDVASWYEIEPFIEFLKNAIRQPDIIIQRKRKPLDGYKVLKEGKEFFTIAKNKSGMYSLSLPATKTEAVTVLDATRVPMDELCNIYDLVELTNEVNKLCENLYELNIKIIKEDDDDSDIYTITNYKGDKLFEISKNGLGNISMTIPLPEKHDDIVIGDNLADVTRIFQIVEQRYKDLMINTYMANNEYNM